MLSRREVVSQLATGTAGAAVAWAVGSGRARAATIQSAGTAPQGALAHDPAMAGVDAGAPATLSAPAPWALVRPLSVGTVVGAGWQVAGLSGVVDGVCVLTLRHDGGREQRVHLCHNDGRPQGLVQTAQFDLVVMNGGQGELPTEEGLAQAVAAVAQAVAANEGQWAGAPRGVLLTQAQRVAQFAGPMDRRLR